MTVVLAVHGTRAVRVRLRCIILVFPYIFSPSFEPFSLLQKFWRSRDTCRQSLFAVHRFKASVHVLVQFRAVFTVTEVLVVDGTRFVILRLQCTVLGSPYTFSLSSELFLP